MTDTHETTAVDHEKWQERAASLYSAYRATGWALSSTIILFATALLAWGVPSSVSEAPPSRWWVLQVCLGLITVICAFGQQFCYYNGSMWQARILFEPTEGDAAKTRKLANKVFSAADRLAVLATAGLALTLAASVGLWASRQQAPEPQPIGRFQVIGSGSAVVLLDTATGLSWHKCTTPQGQSYSVSGVVFRPNVAEGQEGWCVLYFEAHAPRLDEKMFGLTYPLPPPVQQPK